MHVGLHWTTYIRIFGALKEFASGRFEALHSFVKAWKKATNHQSPAVDIGLRVVLSIEMQLLYGPYLEFMQGLQRQHRQAVTRATLTVFPVIELHSRLTAIEQTALRGLFGLAPDVRFRRATPFAFIVLPSGAKVKCGEFVRYSALNARENEPRDRRHFLQVTSFLRVLQPGNDAPMYVCIGNPLILAEVDGEGEFDDQTGLLSLVRLGRPADIIAIFIDQIYRE